MMQGGMSPYMLVAQNQMAQQQYQLQLQQQMLAQAGYQEVRSSLGKNPFNQSGHEPSHHRLRMGTNVPPSDK